MATEIENDPKESKIRWLIPLAFGIILVSVLIVCGVVFGVVLTRPRKSSPQGGTNVTAQPRVTTTMKPLPDMNVIIIGAGMAGLAAARTLHDQGVPFTILEASNRVGGRMMDVNFHGYTVELGANWVQGTEGNPIWDLAKEANLTGIMTDWESYTVRNSTGHDVTDEADDEYDRLLSVAEEKIVEIALEKGKDKETDLSVRGALRSVGWIPTTPVQNAIEYFDYDYEMGDIPKMTSLRYGAFKTHDAFEDEEYLVTDQRGFSYMARYYAGKFLSQNDTRLKLGEWVTDVSYGPNGARVLTKSGTEYQPDFVISTVSLGVLQRKGINFSPEFPEWKDTVLHKHLMTTFLKIYIKFPDNITAFWDETESIIYAGQRRGYYSAWLNVNAEGVHKGANILCVIVTEREAFRIDTMTDQQVLAEIMEVLRNMYGQGIPEAEDIIVPRLHSDPLQYGSYSNWPYGMLGEDFKAFKAPLDRLYFAGEAFSDDYFGYIHGAYFSGIETAEEVLKCMRGSCKNFVPKAETCYVK